MMNDIINNPTWTCGYNCIHIITTDMSNVVKYLIPGRTCRHMLHIIQRTNEWSHFWERGAMQCAISGWLIKGMNNWPREVCRHANKWMDEVLYSKERVVSFHFTEHKSYLVSFLPSFSLHLPLSFFPPRLASRSIGESKQHHQRPG